MEARQGGDFIRERKISQEKVNSKFPSEKNLRER